VAAEPTAESSPHNSALASLIHSPSSEVNLDGRMVRFLEVRTRVRMRSSNGGRFGSYGHWGEELPSSIVSVVGVTATGRKMLGATNPLESAPGTIRGDYCVEVERNICHGSDSVKNAEREIDLWFGEGVVLEWDSYSNPWVYE